MPMNKDPNGGGTEKDGSKNTKYCSYCYKDGEFVGGNVSLEEYVKFVRDEMKKSKCGIIDRFMVWFFIRKCFLKNLDRWKQK
jgi:hypothetical protein